jgi:hydroxyacylglutathione hydrolase
MPVVRIEVPPTNCYLLRGPGGTVLIDPGPPGAATAVIARAEEAGVHPDDVRLIFVTHGHLDHYGAAAQVQAWCGAPVSAYPGEPEFSQDRRNALPPAQTVRGSIVRWFYLLLSPLAEFKPLRADVLLQDDQDLSEYRIEGRTVLLPGHSPGSLGIISSEGDAFVGDLFVNYTVPSRPMYLSDEGTWAQSHERVKALGPRTVYIGHGEPFEGDKLDHIYPARYQLRWWVR